MSHKTNTTFLYPAYYSVCSCGWSGPTRTTEYDAEIDGRIHEHHQRKLYAVVDPNQLSLFVQYSRI